MKDSKILLRSLQILASAAIGLLALMLLAMFNVISLPPLNELFNNVQNRPADAQKVRRPRTASASRSYRDFLEAGDRALFLGDKTQAVEYYKNASSLEPREYLPYEKLGDVYFAQKNYELGRDNFELANSLRSSNSLQIKIIRNILGMRRIIEAKTKLEQIQPQTQESLYYSGLISAFLNEQDKAKESLSKSLALGLNEQLKLSAQKILAAYRDFDLAREAPIEFLQTLLAQAFDQIGEYPLAIELSFEAIKKQNDYRDAWIVLGHAFLNETKWADAEDALTKAIQLDASHPAPYFFRAMARTNLRQTDTAIADFNQALRTGWQPRILANWNLAEIYFGMNNFSQAFSLYKDVVKTDPSDINKFARPIALAINHLNKPEEALELAQTAYNAHPNTSMAHSLLGWAFLGTNNFSQSREHLQQALTLDPQLDSAYLNLGQLAQREGNLFEAASNYQKAMELAESNGNKSISDTATLRYNEAVRLMQSQNAAQAATTTESALPSPIPAAQPNANAIPGNAPQSEIVPSLSLL